MENYIPRMYSSPVPRARHENETAILPIGFLFNASSFAFTERDGRFFIRSFRKDESSVVEWEPC